MRIRFSVRALLTVTTAVCVILAIWLSNREKAIDDVRTANGAWKTEVLAPFLLNTETIENVDICHETHFWCFGAVVKIPFLSVRKPNRQPLFLTITPRIIIQQEEELLPIGPVGGS